MDRKNKICKILLGAVVMLALTTSAYAIPRGPCEPKPDATVCCEEPSPGPFAFSYAKDLGLSCPRDFYLQATFLLMQAYEDGLEFAVKQTNIREPGLANNRYPLEDGVIQGFSSDEHSTDWNFGFRIACGFYLNHDAWDLSAAWTYFRINNDKSSTVNGGILLPLWLDPGIDVVGDVADGTNNNITSSARWTANLNSFDLRLGKPYHVSRYVILNPHFGMRFGWIEQDFLSRNGGTYRADQGTDTNVDMTADNDFWGVGARAGLDTEWHLGSGWFLFGNIAASMLYSFFDICQDVNFEQADRTELKHEFTAIVPNADIALGICWNKYFSKNRYLFALKAAYEFQAWFDQNRLMKFYEGTACNGIGEVGKGNLYLSGFAFTAGLDF